MNKRVALIFPQHLKCVCAVCAHWKLFKSSSERVCVCLCICMLLFGVLLLILLSQSLFLFIMRNFHLYLLQFLCICVVNDSLLAHFYRIMNCSDWFGLVWFAHFAFSVNRHNHILHVANAIVVLLSIAFAILQQIVVVVKIKTEE